MPSISCGTNGPSLHSKMTETDSMDSSLCQTFLGISTPYTPSSWLKTILSMTLPSSLYVVERTLPRRITNDSSFVGCRWMGTSVPGSTAFKHPLVLVLLRLLEVIVHPLLRRFFRPSINHVPQIIIIQFNYTLYISYLTSPFSALHSNNATAT